MSRMQKQRIEELARLLDGEVTEASSREAERLLVLANAVRDNAPELERPTPAFRAQLRTQLVEEAATTAQVQVLDRVREVVRERTTRWRNSARVATASVTATLMIGSASAAVASQSALPGELLYPLKQATESVRLALAGSPEEVGRVQLDLARERLEELTEGIETLSAAQVIETLDAMDRHTEIGAEELLAAFERTQAESLLEDLQRFTGEQRSGLTALLDALPLEAVPFADRSFELLRRIDLQSAISAIACDCGLNASAEGVAGASGAAGRGITAPGEGPAAPDCDCADDAGAPTARDTGLLPDPVDVFGDDGASAAGEQEPEDGGVGTIGSGGSSGLTAPVEELTDPIEEVTDGLTEPVEQATDGSTEPVEEVTDGLTEPVEQATEPIGNVTDEVTEPVEQATEPIGNVIDELTGSEAPTATPTDVADVVDDTVDEVGDLLP